MGPNSWPLGLLVSVFLVAKMNEGFWELRSVAVLLSAVKSCALAVQVSKCTLASIHHIHFEFSRSLLGHPHHSPCAWCPAELPSGCRWSLRWPHGRPFISESSLSLERPFLLGVVGGSLFGRRSLRALTSGLLFCIGCTERVVPWLTEGVPLPAVRLPPPELPRRSSWRGAHGLLTCRAATCACSAGRVFRPRVGPPTRRDAPCSHSSALLRCLAVDLTTCGVT